MPDLIDRLLQKKKIGEPAANDPLIDKLLLKFKKKEDDLADRLLQKKTGEQKIIHPELESQFITEYPEKTAYAGATEVIQPIKQPVGPEEKGKVLPKITPPEKVEPVPSKLSEAAQLFPFSLPVEMVKGMAKNINELMVLAEMEQTGYTPLSTGENRRRLTQQEKKIITEQLGAKALTETIIWKTMVPKSVTFEMGRKLGYGAVSVKNLEVIWGPEAKAFDWAMRNTLGRIADVLKSRNVNAKEFMQIHQKAVELGGSLDKLSEFEREVFELTEKIAQANGMKGGFRELYSKMVKNGYTLRYTPSKGWHIPGYETGAKPPSWVKPTAEGVKPELVKPEGELLPSQIADQEAKQAINLGTIKPQPENKALTIALEKEIIPQIVAKSDMPLFISGFHNQLRAAIERGGKVDKIVQDLKGLFGQQYGKPITLPGEVLREVKAEVPIELKQGVEKTLELEQIKVPKTVETTKLKRASFQDTMKEELTMDNPLYNMLTNRGQIRIPAKMTEEFKPLKDVGLLTKDKSASTLDEIASDMGLDEDELRQQIIKHIDQYRVGGAIREAKGRYKLTPQDTQLLKEYYFAVQKLLKKTGLEKQALLVEFGKLQSKAKPLVDEYPGLLEKMGLDEKNVSALKDRLIYTDEKGTGLLNRRAEFEAGNELIKQNYNLVFIDIKKFKLFNDKYGQAQGDQVMNAIGETLNGYMANNPGAFTYRDGGDEYVMLIPDEITGAEMIDLDKKIGALVQKKVPEAEIGDIPHIRSVQGKPANVESFEDWRNRLSKGIKNLLEGEEHKSLPPPEVEEYNPFETKPVAQPAPAAPKVESGPEMKIEQQVYKEPTPPAPQPKQTEFVGASKQKMILEDTPEQIEAARKANEELASKPNLFQQKAPPEAYEAPQKELFSAGPSPEAVNQPLQGLEPEQLFDIEILKGAYKKFRWDKPIKDQKAFSESIHELYTHAVDRMHPIARLVTKETEKKLFPMENPKLLAYIYSGWQNQVVANLDFFTFRINKIGNVEITGPSLRDIILPYAKNYQDIVILQTNKHELEMLEQGREIVGVDVQKNLKEIGALKNKYGAEKFAKLEMVGKQITEWANRALIQPLVDIGEISEASAKRILEQNQNHLPAARVFEELEAEGLRAGRNLGFLKKYKGSKRQIINPLQELIERDITVQELVARRRVTNAIINLPYFDPTLAGEIYEVAADSKEPFKLMTKVAGVPKYYRVPAEIYKTYNDMTTFEMNNLIKIIGLPKRMLQAGATLTLEFQFGNLSRDSFVSLILSKYGFIPFVDHLPAIFKMVVPGQDWGKFLASGGGHQTLFSLDRARNGYKFYQLLGKKDLMEIVNPLRLLERIGEFMENATRFGEYLKGKGLNEADLLASYASYEVSVNFQRFGRSMGIPRQTTAFYTAGISGLDRIVRAFKEKPVRTSLLALTTLTLPALAAYAYFHNDKRWKRLPPWRKYGMINIPIPGNKEIPFIQFPLPWEIGVLFYGAPIAILEQLNKENPRAVEHWAEQFKQSILPGYQGLPVPTALMPILEDQAKYNFFFQRPMPPKSIQKLPPELQYTPYTSEIAKALGKWLNKSPTVLENYAFTWGGGMARDVINLADQYFMKRGLATEVLHRRQTAPEAQLPKTLADYPLTTKFVGREPIGFNSQPMIDFYDALEKARQQKEAFTVLMQRHSLSFEESQKYANWLALESALSAISGEINKLTKMREKVLWSEEDPKVKKNNLDAIDEVMTIFAEEAVTNFYYHQNKLKDLDSLLHKNKQPETVEVESTIQ